MYPKKNRYHNGGRNVHELENGRKSSWYPSGASYRYGSFGFFPSETWFSACSN